MSVKAAAVEESAAAETSYVRQVGLAGLGLAVWIGESGQTLCKRLADRSHKIAQETGQVFSRLVEKGEKAKPRGRERMKAAASRLEQASGTAKQRIRAPFEFVGSRFRAGMSKSEETIDSKISAALKKRGFPTREEIQALLSRLDELSEKLDKIQPRGTARKSSAGSKSSARQKQ